MHEQVEQLEEFLDLSPIGLKYYGQIQGQDLHSNNRIEDYIINWCTNSPSTSKIMNIVSTGIRNKIIIIGYEDKSMIKQMWFSFRHTGPKIFRMDPTKGLHVLGYYSMIDKKIAAVLDKNVTLSGKSVREVPPILCHELIHFAANVNPTLMIRLCGQSHLLPFYRELTTQISPASKIISDSDLLDTILELAINMEGDIGIRPTVHTSVNIWTKYFNKAPGVNGEQAAILIVLPFVHYFLESKKVDRKLMIKSLKMHYTSYRKIGINAVSFTTAGQETQAPSEILAISNQFNPHPNIIKLINSIPIRKYSGPNLI